LITQIIISTWSIFHHKYNYYNATFEAEVRGSGAGSQCGQHSKILKKKKEKEKK
jgi:hypothetical protein